jgi:hypothetical protein
MLPEQTSLGGFVLSKNDKIAILGSALLLLAILTAGGFGLSKAYRYNEPTSDVETTGR